MPLPPGVLAQRLVGTFPQLVLCDTSLFAALKDYLNPTTNPDLSQFIQWLQANPDVAAATGDILAPPGDPQTGAAPLDAALVQALLPLLVSTSAWIADQPAFEDVAWSVQSGVAPGPETPQPADGSWTLARLGPIGGLEFAEIAFGGPDDPSFSLSLVNDQPRHLSAYASFTRNGVAVTPAGWTSRLPSGVPAGFESDTVKYLGMLAPNQSVAGIAVPAAAQALAFPLPANADAAMLSFGGLGNGGFSAIPDAAGVMASFVLDIFVPWMIAQSGTSPGGLASWYDGVLADQTILAQAIASGAFLLDRVEGTDAMLAALSDNLCGAVLGKLLVGLRKSIVKELGAPPSDRYSWVDQFAPAAGWPAQLVEAFLAGGLNAQYWATGTPSPIALELSPATTVTLGLTLLPDPATGVWPYAATSLEATIAYAGGWSQCLTAAMPAPQSAVPQSLAFGSVRNAGPIAVSVTLRDAGGLALAHGTASVSPPTGGSRDLSAQVTLSAPPPSVDAGTGYKLAARLGWRDGAYLWDAGAAQSTAVGLGKAGQGAAITSLDALTLQGAQLCLGYAWGASNQNVAVCGGTAPLQNAYFVQDIGTAVPAAQYKPLGCGLVAAPLLAYAAGTGGSGPGAGGYYLDNQGSGAAFLRPVAFGAGPFGPPSGTSVARFAARSSLSSLCVSPAGVAAAVSRDLGLLQTVALAPAGVPDAQAPVALSHAGPGTRIGLLGAPVAVAATQGGSFLVLEQGNARVQAFDADGNPVPLFGGAPAFALQAASQPVYRDLAVSPAGLIYVLGSQNGGGSPSDFFLDIHTPDGAALSRTSGINAARIAVDAANTLFTLDFDSLTGPGGRIEPVLSAWHPGS